MAKIHKMISKSNSLYQFKLKSNPVKPAGALITHNSYCSLFARKIRKETSQLLSPACSYSALPRCVSRRLMRTTKQKINYKLSKATRFKQLAHES